MREIRAGLASVSESLFSFPTARAFLIAVHAIKMWDWFHLIDFTVPLPILNVDYVQFYGRALRAHEFLSASGRFWGYDPFDMAGYVSGPFLEVGVHFISLLSHVLSPVVPIHVTMLFLEVAGLCLAPFLIVAAVRNFGGTRAQAWSAFALNLVIFGFLDPFSEHMFRVGLYGFMVSGFVALYQVSLVWRWLAAGSWRVGLLLCVVTAILFQIHPASLVVVIVPNVVLFASFAPRMDRWRLAATLAFVVLAVAANYYWIRPFVAFADWKTDAPYFVTAGFRDLLRTFNPWKRDLFLAVRITMLVYIVGLAVSSVAGMWKRDRTLGATGGLWVGWLFLCGYFGSAIPVLRELQPGRNEFAFWLVSGVAAGMSIPTFVLAYAGRRRFAAVIYVGCLALMFAPLPRPGRAFPPITNQFSDGQQQFLDALRTRRVDGRILVECTDWLSPHVADLLPFTLPGQPFLGGQHPGNFLKGRFSLFSGAYGSAEGWVNDRPIAFNRQMADMSSEMFEDYLRLYNVRTVAARTEAMRAALARYPSVLGEPEPAGDFVFYAVRNPSTWFDEGSGRVSFALDRITIEDASTGRMVLRSHWIKTLRIDPETPLEPVYLSDDPVPFIAIDNAAGHRRLVVYNAGL